MSNELKKNLTQTASRRFIDGFANHMVALQYVDRQILEGLYNAKSGDTVTMKVPTQYKGVDLMNRANGAMTSADIESIETGTISAKINHFDGLALQWDKIEEALEADQLDELLKPATRKLVSRLEDKIFFEAMVGAAGMTGDPTDAAKIMKSWLDMREVKAYFTKIGSPDLRPNAFLDPDVFTSISSDVKTSFNPDIVGEAIREYYGGRLAGVDTFETMYTGVFDGTAPAKGALAAETTFAYKDLDDANQCVITLKTAANVKRGQKFTIAGVNAINQENKRTITTGSGQNKLQVFTVVKDSTGTSLTVSPALIGSSDEAHQNVSAPGAADAVVTFIDLKDRAPSIIWQPDALAVAFVPLKPVSTAEGYTAKQDGVSIRAQKQGDVMGNTDTLRFDVMAAIKVIDPLKIVLGFGQ
ncbi:MAG: P22 phage major capsid protein family protein [Pseudomonadota bacterium]